MVGKASIILVIGFGFILGYISLNLNNIATQAVDNMSQYTASTESHNLALTGVNVGLSKFYQDTSWRGPITYSSDTPPIKGRYTVGVTPVGVGKLRLRSVSTYHASPVDVYYDTVEVYFDSNKLNSFTLLAWMTEFEGNVFWITGDTVWGRIHSNGNLHVNGRPVFMEKATTSKGFNPRVGTGTNKAIFKQGYETGVATIDFPTDLKDIYVAATSATGRYYTQDIWVTLEPGTSANGDGKVYVRESQSGPIIDSIALGTSSFNGALMGAGRVNLQGTLDGQLTVASMTNIYIMNDVRYEVHPSQGKSDDLLGIVAEKNVVVANNAANNNHCEIHGSVFTRDGSFYAEDYNTRGPSGELRVFGSLVQKTRGAVGTFSGSSLTSGFSKRYRYDPRLADPTFRPPFYPGFYVKTYAITNWWESVRMPKFR